MARGYRIGHGFDVHRLRRGRKLVLGGVEIPHALGLDGHSDADVLLHALINALLGALGKGDIGTHFPDSDPRYRGISSATLLKRVVKMMAQAGYRLVNADLTVVAEKPRLNPFSRLITRRMAELLEVSASRVNVKAATAEKLGSIGRGLAVAATAVVLLDKQ